VSTADDRPALRVIRGGKPTDEEIAALVVTLSALGSEPDPVPELRQPLSPWVASGLVKGTRTKA
jgi:hypothetical protein